MSIASAELSAIRSDLAATWAHRCSIQRRTVGAADGYGEPTYSAWFNNATNVPCRLSQERSTGEQVTPEAARNIRQWSLIMAATTDVTTADQIVGVTNALNETVLAGPANIQQVIRFETHLRIVLGALS